MPSRASGVSILAQTSTPLPVEARTASRSAAERTNETATLSTPSSRRIPRRSMSSVVGVLSASREAGAVSPRTSLHLAAGQDPRPHAVAVPLLCNEGDPAITDGDPVALLQGSDQLWQRDTDPASVAARGQPRRAEVDDAARCQGHPALRERRRADLGAREVRQDPDVWRGLADAAQPGHGLLDRPVGERQAGDVHPRRLHGGDGRGVVRGGPDRRHDAGPAATFQAATGRARGDWPRTGGAGQAS